MKLVTGLGNPGRRYRETRHNLGFRVVDAISEKFGIACRKKRKLSARIGRGAVDGTQVLLAKPETFVNASGLAVRKIMDYFEIAMSDLLVITDDVDLPPGTIRIRARGGAGGHKGLISIIETLGGNQFARIRLGIGGQKLEDLTGHVLARPSPDEEEAYRRAVEIAVDAAEDIFREGIEKAMNDYNRTTQSDQIVSRR